MREIILGLNENQNQVSYAEIDQDNVIKRLSVRDFIHPESSYDKNAYLTWSGSGFSDVKGVKFEVGQKLAKTFKPKISKRMLKLIEDAYQADGSYCSNCGTFHDMDQYGQASFVITHDNDFLCKECVTAEDVLLELDTPNGVFSAKDVSGVDLTSFEEIAELFCDSSGAGADYEPALTKHGTEAMVAKLLAEHDGEQLYCGITDMGQFQVYVTIYRKTA